MGPQWVCVSHGFGSVGFRVGVWICSEAQKVGTWEKVGVGWDSRSN